MVGLHQDGPGSRPGGSSSGRSRVLGLGVVAVALAGGGTVAAVSTSAAVSTAGTGTGSAALASSSGDTTLFADDFSAGMSRWTAAGGSWRVTPAGRLSQGSTTRSARAITGSGTWTDYTVQARVQPRRLTADGSFLGISARATGSTSYSRLVLLAAGRAEVQVVRRGRASVLASSPLTVVPGSWHTLRLEVQGATLRGSVDGVPVAPLTGAARATPAPSGWIGLDTSRATAQFDNVSVTRPAGPAPVTPIPTMPPTRTVTPTPIPTVTPPTLTPTPTPTVSPTPGGGWNPGPAVAWNPPANLSAALAKVWAHQESTYNDLYGFTNYLWDQIIAGKGNLNYCVRWDSTASVTATQRDAIQAQLARQFQTWMDAMTVNGQGWNGWPYPKVNVKVVGWATANRSLLQWNDSSVDVYVGDLNEGAAQCTPPCGRFFHQNNDYSGCPGGPAHHYDLSLWLTDGFSGGAGGDWGQRIGREYYLGLLTADNVHILLHELGHSYGLDDFYDWDPGVGGFIMMAGSATRITEFDTWMLRDWWRHLKTRYRL